MEKGLAGSWWVALVVGVWLALGFVGIVEGAGGAVCHCNCCAQLSGDCAATAFAVADCSHCTNEACWDRKCKDAVVIESSCLAVKPALTLVVVLSLLCGIAILLVLSVLRYHLPFIRRLFRIELATTRKLQRRRHMFMLPTQLRRVTGDRRDVGTLIEKDKHRPGP